MKLSIALLTLACSSIQLSSVAWAQVNGTFNGHNGPQPNSGDTSVQNPGGDYWVDPGRRYGERFKVNIHGQGSVNTIEIVTAGGDQECGRPFYIEGTIIYDANHRTGTLDGEMLRCTNPKLLPAPCSHQPQYKVRCTGTVLRSDDQSGYIIDVTYPDEKWLPEDCPDGKKRTDIGKERIILSYIRPLPAPPPPDSWTEWARKKFDQGFRDTVSGRAYDKSGLR